VRGEHDQRELQRNITDPTVPPFTFSSEQDDSFPSFQPKLGVNYHWSDAVESWFVVSTGYQPGGFSVSQNDPLRAPFDAAKSIHLELGASGACWDDRFRASVSGFWIESEDYQVYRPVFPYPSYEVTNAERARTLGAELELRLRPIEQIDFRVAAGLVDAEFTDYIVPDPFTGGSIDLSGRTINFVPEFTLDASITYRHRTGIFGTVGGTVVGQYWYDELNTVEQPAYALLHARAGWSNDRFEVALYGRNILEEEYYANVLDLGAFFPAGQFVGTPGDPAVFGAEISARF
jgi:outer membrane receptor protein involved in Fe transport